MKVMRKRFIIERVPVCGYLLWVAMALFTITANAYAYEAGLCEFDDPEDAFKAVNRAIMDNPSKYTATDQNNNRIADSLESEHHALSGGTLFGNYMCSEFAALFMCVLKEEYNCDNDDVQMATGPAINGGGRHAVTALNERILKNNGGNQPVDGYVHVDTSWPDYNNNHLRYRDGGGTSVRDGLFNAGPQQCADGFAVARGTGGGGGLFGSGGGSQMTTQALMSMMMNSLMNRMGQQKKKPPLVQDAYEAMERQKRIAAAYTANAQIAATNAAQEAAARAAPIPQPSPTPPAEPIPLPEDGDKDALSEDLSAEGTSSARAKLGDPVTGSYEMKLPPDPALR